MRGLSQLSEYWWIFGTEPTRYKMIAIGPYIDPIDTLNSQIRHGLEKCTLIVPSPIKNIYDFTDHVRDRISYLKAAIGEE